MVARVAVASNSAVGKDPATVGISGIQFGEQNPNLDAQETVTDTMAS